MSDEDHDPFNEPEKAHARARELMTEDFFWDCVDEEAPFGSDEGNTAYFEYRGWRAENPAAPLTECLSWIMDGQLSGYTLALCQNEQIEQDLDEPDEAFLSAHYDMFTLDATIIATALGQLLDEGRIDQDAKPYIRVAIQRQSHPKVTTSEKRSQFLVAIERVIDLA